MKNFKKITIILCILCIYVFIAGFVIEGEKDFIKWVDCKVPYEVLLCAYNYDKEFYNSKEVEFNFIKSLAYLATKNGNKFNIKKDINELNKLVAQLKDGKKIDDFYGDNKYYKYYVEGYSAIFNEFIGEYDDESGNVEYGLKNHHPFPKGFWYNHYDDFGISRSYGYKRKHLGHDFMGSIGTPLVAIEGGEITELGWNKYGGWIITIRSFDKKRAYYYAHLRKGAPYANNLKIGNKINAGDVIGYLGVTGYSTKEDSNMSCAPHLHLGMQLIFDESQVSGPTEIWIDMYQISKWLSHNRVNVIKQGNEYIRANESQADIFKFEGNLF